MMTTDTKAALDYLIDNLELKVTVTRDSNYSDDQEIKVEIKIKDEVVAEDRSTMYFD